MGYFIDVFFFENIIELYIVKILKIMFFYIKDISFK